MDKSTYDLILSIPLSLLVIGLIVGGIRFKKLGTAQRLLILIFGFTLTTEVISRILLELEIRNYIVFHIYALVEYGLFATILSLHLYPKERKWVKISIGLMTLFGILNFLFLQNVQELNTNVITTSSIALVLLSVLLFFRILSKMVYSRIERSSFFWINIGILIYFSSSLVLFVSGDWLTQLDLAYSINVWVIHILFNIIQYLCFNIALWMDPE